MGTGKRDTAPEVATLLHKSDLEPNPVEQFRRWFTDATAIEGSDATAMTLATADADGRPSARIVLLKAFDDEGFIFFTNYNSRKSRDLEANPQAMLVFWWQDQVRQVRISGSVKRADADVSDAYFQSRPRGSQMGAWASPQSEVIPDRSYLERRLHKIEERFGEGPVERPPYWGGFILAPDEFEFWQGGHDRLHDRFRYSLEGDGWRLERLGP